MSEHFPVGKLLKAGKYTSNNGNGIRANALGNSFGSNLFLIDLPTLPGTSDNGYNASALFCKDLQIAVFLSEFLPENQLQISNSNSHDSAKTNKS